MTASGLGRLLRWTQPLFLIAATGLIVYMLYSYWPELRAHPWRLNWVWFAAACGLLLVTWWFEILIWRNLLHALGGRIGIRPALSAWFQSAIIRYIPGNVWQPLSLTWMCTRHGVRPEATMASIVLFQVITLLGTLPLAALYIIFKADAELAGFLGAIPWQLPLGLTLAPLILFLVNPLWLLSLLNWLLRRVRRAELGTGLTRRTLFAALLLAFFDWVLWGATFAALTYSLGVYSWAEIQYLTPHLIAIYPLAYAIGFVSLITPSGFGVREGALYVLLTPYLPGVVVTVIALAMRLWVMLGELILAGIALLMERGRPESTLLVHEPRPPTAMSPAPAQRLQAGAHRTPGVGPRSDSSAQDTPVSAPASDPVA